MNQEIIEPQSCVLSVNFTKEEQEESMMVVLPASKTASERSGLFQPDTLNSYEIFGGRRRRILEPEKRLMMSILEIAVMDFQKYINSRSLRGCRLHEDAEEWFKNPDEKHLFSFRNVCSNLGLDPNYLLGGLLRWEEARQAGQIEGPRMRSAKLTR